MNKRDDDLGLTAQTALRADGEWPNKQVRVMGDVTAFRDRDGMWIKSSGWSATPCAGALGPSSPIARCYTAGRAAAAEAPARSAANAPASAQVRC